MSFRPLDPHSKTRLHYYLHLPYDSHAIFGILQFQWAIPRPYRRGALECPGAGAWAPGVTARLGVGTDRGRQYSYWNSCCCRSLYTATSSAVYRLHCGGRGSIEYRYGQYPWQLNKSGCMLVLKQHCRYHCMVVHSYRKSPVRPPPRSWWK